MSLGSEMLAIVRSIVENTDAFSVPITCMDELGVTAVVNGLVNETALMIDPDTGVSVAGKQASAVVSRAAIVDSGLTYPRAIADLTSKAWLVAWTGSDSAVRTFKVIEVAPDENPAIDLLTLKLETYDP
ncbi:MAG: hypothetical protein A2V70_04325 [Planctomycetes bacterium RBG_13_63_9]|nr:MAG: hypothetical protein A2V70_04325 [Planctomycetes bacterium RBG_13_63_9]